MYRNKYLKYKSKYINLVNMIGGGYETAKRRFIASIKKNYTFLLDDPVLLPIKSTLLSDIKDNTNKIFDHIIKLIEYNKDIPNFNIDWIIISYTNGTFGTPNSISPQNIANFIDSEKSLLYLNSKIKTLTDNITKKKRKLEETNSYKTYQTFVPKLEPKDTSITNYESLNDLDRFLNNPMIIQLIQDFKNESDDKDDRHRKLKEKGEDDIIFILETTNVKIVQPTTVDGSKYYGSNTKWCTTGDNNNMFDEYNENGPLYIIESKTNHTKFQFQSERPEGVEASNWMFMNNVSELMDSSNKPISIQDVIKQCNNDTGLLEWFKTFKLKDQPIIIDNTRENILLINYNLQFNILKSNETIYDEINKSINSNDKLEELDLDIKFWNMPLGNLLNRLTNLKSLKLDSYNYQLGNSLNRLTNLKSLILDSYNSQLGNSLDRLISMTDLYLFLYNLPLGNSLDQLISMTNLYLNSYNLPLGNSLDRLTSMIRLHLNLYNIPLGNSLDQLTNLIELQLDSFNIPLGNSLDQLTSMRSLQLDSFNIPLDNSLDRLTSMRSLQLDSFNLSLGNSLDRLSSITQLRLDSFNLPLGNSLNHLSSLKNLYLKSYNIPLGNSLDQLTSLQNLMLYSYNLPLGNSLDRLTSMTQLHLDSYNLPLGNSLDQLTNLTYLLLDSYNIPLGNSLDRLTSLTDLHLDSYSLPIGNLLDRLPKLESYNIPL